MTDPSGFGIFLSLNYWRSSMTEQQFKAGARVRVTYEATVGAVPPDDEVLLLTPGDDRFAVRYHRLPAGAVVEVLKPPTLAEHMAALATELEQAPGYGGYADGMVAAADRIREALAAYVATDEPTGEQPLCGARYSHGPRHPVVSCTRSAGHEGAHNWAELLEATR